MISRRDFVKLALTSLGAFLTSCLPQGLRDPAPTPTTAATNTPLPPPTDTPPPTPTPAPAASLAPTLTSTPTVIPCFRLLTPENGAPLPLMEKITFTWQPMPGAASYQLHITLPGGKLLAVDTPTTSTTRYAGTFLESGMYTWRVLALDGNGQQLCVTEPFTFQKPALPTPDKGGSYNHGGGDGSMGGDDGPGGGTIPGGPGGG